jgi:hypothetical protein
MHILSFCSLIDPQDVINPDAFKSVVAAVNAAQSAKTLACLPKIPQCVWGCLPPNIDLDHLFAPILKRGADASAAISREGSTVLHVRHDHVRHDHLRRDQVRRDPGAAEGMIAHFAATLRPMS